MVDPNSENQNAQSVLFLGTQTENLQYMYRLVQKLTNQIAQNKHHRSLITNHIDTLANRINNNNPHRHLSDLNLIAQFLDHRHFQPSTDTDNPAQTLRTQNIQLKQLLHSRQQRNRSALTQLQNHQQTLHTVVALLRNHIYNVHVTTLQRLRTLFNEHLVPIEDHQFASFLESINDLQLLLDLCELYRTILRLHP